jgi:hypothetical protein
MKINRTSIAAGLAIGVLAGGAGGALAATTSSGAGSATTSSATTTATSGWTGYGDGWSRGARWQDRPGDGWGRGAQWRDRPGDGWGQWRHPGPGVGWPGRGTGTTMMGGGW